MKNFQKIDFKKNIVMIDNEEWEICEDNEIEENDYEYDEIEYSYFGDKNRCYDSVKLLLDEAKRINKEMNINIHCLLSKETYDSVFELIEDYHSDPRLKGMGSIVFLSLKQKGRGEYFNQLTEDEFKKIIDTCFEKHVNMGFDSCSAPKFLKAIENRADHEELEKYVESCESTLFSAYIDCEGNFYPCSFMEKEGNWKTGINLLNCNNFLNDVWNNLRTVEWRNEAIHRMKCNHGCNFCPYYKI